MERASFRKKKQLYCVPSSVRFFLSAEGKWKSFFLCEIQYIQEYVHYESHICFARCNVTSNLIVHVWNIKKFVILLLCKTREYSDKKKHGEISSVFSGSLEMSPKSYLFNIRTIFCIALYTLTANCCAPGSNN